MFERIMKGTKKDDKKDAYKEAAKKLTDNKAYQESISRMLGKHYGFYGSLSYLVEDYSSAFKDACDKLTKHEIRDEKLMDMAFETALNNRNVYTCTVGVERTKVYPLDAGICALNPWECYYDNFIECIRKEQNVGFAMGLDPKGGFLINDKYVFFPNRFREGGMGVKSLGLEFINFFIAKKINDNISIQPEFFQDIYALHEKYIEDGKPLVKKNLGNRRARRGNIPPQERPPEPDRAIAIGLNANAEGRGGIIAEEAPHGDDFVFDEVPDQMENDPVPEGGAWIGVPVIDDDGQVINVVNQRANAINRQGRIFFYRDEEHLLLPNETWRAAAQRLRNQWADEEAALDAMEQEEIRREEERLADGARWAQENPRI